MIGRIFHKKSTQTPHRGWAAFVLTRKRAPGDLAAYLKAACPADVCVCVCVFHHSSKLPQNVNNPWLATRTVILTQLMVSWYHAINQRFNCNPATHTYSVGTYYLGVLTYMFAPNIA